MTNDSEDTSRQTECPPSDASDVNSEVYRCCKNDPPEEREMQTAEEQERLLDADPCLRRALSVFLLEEDATHQIRLFRRWKKKFIAKAQLSSQHGKAKATGKPTHTSWWPADSLTTLDRAELFTVVCEVEQ